MELEYWQLETERETFWAFACSFQNLAAEGTFRTKRVLAVNLVAGYRKTDVDQAVKARSVYRKLGGTVER